MPPLAHVSACVLQGIFGLPKCTSANNTLCETMRSLLELGAYLPVVQNRLVQAQYWHDPENEARYAKENVFLPGINNQAAHRTPEYAKRLMSREFSRHAPKTFAQSCANHHLLNCPPPSPLWDSLGFQSQQFRV